jgi:hypothetical protein
MPTDADFKKLLAAAGLPARYHRKDIGLSDLPDPAKGLLAQEIENFSNLRRGEVTDCRRWFFTGSRGLEAAYLYVRALCLHRVRATVVTVPELLTDAGNPYVDEDKVWAENRVVVLAGFTESGGARLPGDEERLYGVQWFLRRWMDGDHVLMFHGEVKPAVTTPQHPWWGQSLMREVLKQSTVLEVGA